MKSFLTRLFISHHTMAPRQKVPLGVEELDSRITPSASTTILLASASPSDQILVADQNMIANSVDPGHAVVTVAFLPGPVAQAPGIMLERAAPRALTALVRVTASDDNRNVDAWSVAVDSRPPSTTDAGDNSNAGEPDDSQSDDSDVRH